MLRKRNIFAKVTIGTYDTSLRYLSRALLDSRYRTTMWHCIGNAFGEHSFVTDGKRWYSRLTRSTVLALLQNRHPLGMWCVGLCLFCRWRCNSYELCLCRNIIISHCSQLHLWFAENVIESDRIVKKAKCSFKIDVIPTLFCRLLKRASESLLSSHRILRALLAAWRTFKPIRMRWHI